MLERDIARARKMLILEPYWLDLTEARQGVLLDMAVNMGWARFAEFERMRAALRTGDYAEAARQMEDSRWFHQVGRRGPRNVAIMRNGEWPT